MTLPAVMPCPGTRARAATYVPSVPYLAGRRRRRQILRRARRREQRPGRPPPDDSAARILAIPWFYPSPSSSTILIGHCGLFPCFFFSKCHSLITDGMAGGEGGVWWAKATGIRFSFRWEGEERVQGSWLADDLAWSWDWGGGGWRRPRGEFFFAFWDPAEQQR